MSRSESLRAIALLAAVALGIGSGSASTRPARAQENAAPPHWVWHPDEKTGGTAGAETRWFRKVFLAKERSRIAVDVAADNTYELYLDGREVARGSDWGVAQSFKGEVSTGKHVLAIKATNESPGAAGVLLRGGILPLGQSAAIHTNGSWWASDREPADDRWLKDLEDRLPGWVHARDLGVLGSAPWGNIAFESGDASGRFKPFPGFAVSTVAPPSLTGSVVAFAFDEAGSPCVSVERGPIMRLLDADRDGIYDAKELVEDKVTNCQGFSFIKGKLYAVGDGPQGAGIYRLSGPKLADLELIRKSRGGMGEHGPHAVMMGPDGFLYMNVGNHAHLEEPIAADSPINRFYEGELLPHYNDSRGHAAGIMAPGGEIYRSRDDGKTWERVSAGYRNQYDFAFNRDGEMFTYDSDMEWDIGVPWYRPVRVNHATLGSEFGWRNGTACSPPYFFDSLPTTFDTGRGSPTGVTFYEGGTLGPDWDDTFLICDWSQGRILGISLEIKGGSYAAKSRELVTGQPLNCTDIEAGPDGAVYFSTGGRNTMGGLYRIARSEGAGAVDPDRESPQSSRARVRQATARLKGLEGDAWAKARTAVAVDSKASIADRLLSLDELAISGPFPAEAMLVKLCDDPEVRIRAKAVGLLGIKTGKDGLDRLEAALKDVHPFVRRKACESLVRAGGPIPTRSVLALLGDADVHVRFAARNALEHAKPDEIRDRLLATDDTRALIEGMLVLARAGTMDAAHRDELLGREKELLGMKLPVDQRLDLLRLIQLTYLLGPANPIPDPAIGTALLAAFPSGERRIDAETSRLLAYHGTPGAIAKLLDVQAAEKDTAQQIHYANCLRVFAKGWPAGAHDRLFAWFEGASRWDGGFSYLGFLDFMIQDTLRSADAEVKGRLLEHADRMPFPARVLVRSLDLKGDTPLAGALIDLYPKLDGLSNANAAEELKAAIRDRLARAGSKEATEAAAKFDRLEKERKAPTPSATIREWTLKDAVAESIDSGLLAKASATRGKAVLTKARCLDCHKYANEGKGIGPDLTTLSARFKAADILESIVLPSKVISDQYKSLTIETEDGAIVSGMPVTNDATSVVLLLSDGSQKTIAKKEIAHQSGSDVSVMPEKLLGPLSAREIADMLKFLGASPTPASPAAGGR